MYVTSSQRRELNRCNELLANELGRTQFDKGVYQWVIANEVMLRRKTTQDFVMNDAGILVPAPKYSEVPYVQIAPMYKDRVFLGKHEWIDERAWFAIFPDRTFVWPREGMYHPTNLKTKPGKVADMERTEIVLKLIKYSRSRTVADWDKEGEDIVNAQERSVNNAIEAIVNDSLTAFGNDPGKRSGGVSFGGVSF